MIDEILKLKDGECYVVPEGDYGKAEIWLKNDMYFSFLIPYLGGQAYYLNRGNKDELEAMLKEINNFT